MSEPADFDYDSIPVGYYDQVFHRRTGVQSKWHHLKFDRVRVEIAGRRSHLDIGCGAGTFVGSLDSAAQVVGVDLAEAQIAYARAHYQMDAHRFEVIAPGPLPFPDGGFDLVTIIELVEHLEPDAALALLREAYRVLAPGGRFVITSPNYRSLWPLLEAMVNRLGEVSYADQHINRLDRHRLADLLRRAGFKGVRVEGFLLVAPFAAVLGWDLADRVAALEPRFLVDRLGFLLLGIGEK